MAIKKILIANRGEIACRVIKTAQRLGIKTVAVYSDADARALHVEMADEAYLIGPAAPRESYLNVDKILAVAKQAGADAIHPGYGFLSENAAFAEACAKAGVIFIGPPAASIVAMGGKSEAKALMEKAGVPLVPGYHGNKQDEKFLTEQAEKIGYPVLIKASAGGGGKGMRVVEKAADFADQLAGAKREAQAAFGNDHVLIEKYLVNPRHVEIQVFADAHGNTVYLFERDCSIQRRHQKVLEEAPAPGLSEKTRKKMGDAAVAAAKAIGYVGAGTVEFLLDASENFYFMEMNTRLQVEHPVTEMITGLDLVEMQIRAAEGEELPFTQDDLSINGHAIEVRLYAEDPSNHFLPGAGQVSFLRFPQEEEGVVRVDTGIRDCAFGHGDVISIHYDPMIAKIIVWGEDRDAAIANMQAALDATLLAGPKNNLVFLRDLLKHPAFQSAQLSTSFIEKHAKALLPDAEKPDHQVLSLAVLGILKNRIADQAGYFEKSSDPTSPWHQMSGFRIGGAEAETFVFGDGDQTQNVKVSVARGLHQPQLTFEDRTIVQAGVEPSGYDLGFLARIGNDHMDGVVLQDGRKLTVLSEGITAEVIYHPAVSAADGDEEDAGKLTAPMPGRVVAVRVQLGDSVKKGQPLVIVEAMKMEHTIMAPADGIVEKIHASVGDQVDEKYELIALK